MYIFFVSWEKHTHMITSKWFRFIIVKIYNILCYVIARLLRHMCNLHNQRNWNISKTKQGNQKLKDNLLCYSKCSFK